MDRPTAAEAGSCNWIPGRDEGDGVRDVRDSPSTGVSQRALGLELRSPLEEVAEAGDKRCRRQHLPHDIAELAGRRGVLDFSRAGEQLVETRAELFYAFVVQWALPDDLRNGSRFLFDILGVDRRPLIHLALLKSQQRGQRLRSLACV